MKEKASGMERVCNFAHSLLDEQGQRQVAKLYTVVDERASGDAAPTC